MAAEGYRVLAGVRTEEDSARLRRATQGVLEPVLLDLRSAESLQSAVDAIKEKTLGAGLYALVNNAGLVMPGPLECLESAVWDEQWAVNVRGPFQLTRLLIASLRIGGGRIVNIGSINGLVAKPFIGAYSACKHCMLALSDVLRMELAPWNIHVSVVVPGRVCTPLWEKARASGRGMVDSLDDTMAPLYSGRLSALLSSAEQRGNGGLTPAAVADVVLGVLAASRPRPRYLVGLDARIQAVLKWLLPARRVDRLILRQMGLK
jgi:NAD(P)-dependent dehydrogenase (short-subunit alcohol dehydrogenase family)